jgi:hypothetical protein
MNRKRKKVLAMALLSAVSGAAMLTGARADEPYQGQRYCNDFKMANPLIAEDWCGEVERKPYSS